MAKHEELIKELKQSNPDAADRLEEEIDIIIHKLKFLPTESFSRVIVLSQQLQIYSSAGISEKVKIAGGILLNHMTDNPDKILILQDDDSLYSELPELLERPEVSNSNAFLRNEIYIINREGFDQSNESFLADTEVLAEILQPKYFYYGRNGQEWVKFEL